MCLLSLNNTEIKNSISSINNFKNKDDTIYLLEFDDYINYNDLEIMKIKNNIIHFSLFDTELIDKLQNLDNKLSSVIEDIINSNNDIKVFFNDNFEYFPLLNNNNDTFYIKVSNNNKTDLIKDMTIIYLKTTIQIYISTKYKCSYIKQKISLININTDELSVIDYENLSNKTTETNTTNSNDNSINVNSDNNSISDYNSNENDENIDNNDININNTFYNDTDTSTTITDNNYNDTNNSISLSDNNYNNTVSSNTDINDYNNTDSIHTEYKEENKFTISDNDYNKNENIKFEKVNINNVFKCNKCGKEYKFEKTLNNHKNKCKK